MLEYQFFAPLMPRSGRDVKAWNNRHIKNLPRQAILINEKQLRKFLIVKSVEVQFPYVVTVSRLVHPFVVTFLQR